MTFGEEQEARKLEVDSFSTYLKNGQYNLVYNILVEHSSLHYFFDNTWYREKLLNKITAHELHKMKEHFKNPTLFHIVLFFRIEANEILKKYEHINFNQYSEIDEARKKLSQKIFPEKGNFAKFYPYINRLIKQEKYIIALYILVNYGWYNSATANIAIAYDACNTYINLFQKLNKFDTLSEYYESFDMLKENFEFIQVLINYFLENDQVEKAEQALVYAKSINPSHTFINQTIDNIANKNLNKQLLENNIDLNAINNMDGKAFEELLITQFKKLGFLTLRTPATGDYGADIILETVNGTKIAIQCKRYKSRVNLKAVQEVVGALAHFQADIGVVITNNSYLNSAIKLAQSNDIELWDGIKVMKFLTGDITFSEIYEN